MKLITLVIINLFIIKAYSQNLTIKIVDEYDLPIETVIIKHNNNFWSSDKNGMIKMKSDLINRKDTLYLSHLSYKSAKLLFADLKEIDNLRIIHLQSDLKPLSEVTVSTIDTKKYVEEVIKMIPDNYSNPFNENLDLKTTISFKRIDKEFDDTLIEYTGGLNISLDKKEIYVSKQTQYEYISPNLEENIFFIKPSDFLNIIPIEKHDVIRYYKRYKYPKHEFLEYNGQDAIKIDFKNRKRHGYLIIDRESKAILYINYHVDPTSPWYLGTMKGKGLVKTNLNKYLVEANYIKSSSGKYVFDSGRQNIESTNSWKNNSISTEYDTHIKRENTSQTISSPKIKLKNLFR